MPEKNFNTEQRFKTWSRLLDELETGYQLILKNVRLFLKENPIKEGSTIAERLAKRSYDRILEWSQSAPEVIYNPGKLNEIKHNLLHELKNLPHLQVEVIKPFEKSLSMAEAMRLYQDPLFDGLFKHIIAYGEYISLPEHKSQRAWFEKLFEAIHEHARFRIIIFESVEEVGLPNFALPKGTKISNPIGIKSNGNMWHLPSFSSS